MMNVNNLCQNIGRGAPGGSVGRAGAPYTVAMSSRSGPGFDSTCGPLLRVIPPLSPLFPVHSSAVLYNKGSKAPQKSLYIYVCVCVCVCVCVV